MTTNRWRLKGQYFESCNCEVLCPCVVQSGSVRPTDGHCDVGLAFHIDEGDLNGVSLGGLNFLAANYTPGNMGDGNWTAGYYVDESATPEQWEAMEQILSGEMGGPAERWSHPRRRRSGCRGPGYATAGHPGRDRWRAMDPRPGGTHRWKCLPCRR